jgi:hypothetical protein
MSLMEFADSLTPEQMEAWTDAVSEKAESDEQQPGDEKKSK